MGGNLLKTWGLPEKRLNRAGFLEVLEKVTEVFEKENCKVYPLHFYEDKESFGDLDVIIQDGIIKDLSIFIEKNFGYKPFRNNQTFSFPVEGFQVDISAFHKDIIQSALFYFTSEVGNFEGTIFHKMGLKHSHEGLKYVIRDELFGKGSNFSEEVLLTRDAKKICEIGGFDYKVRKWGFKSKLSMFEYIYNSKYFKSSIFDFESLNHKNRVRNRKRAVFCEFVKYLKTVPEKDFCFKPKSEYLVDIIKEFPFLGERIEKARVAFFKRRELSDKFNGDIVMDLTGLKGEELGKFISLFRKMYPVESLEKMSSEDIKKKIISFATP